MSTLRRNGGSKMKEVISPEVFKDKMEEIKDRLDDEEDEFFDEEIAHEQSDLLMKEILESLGYGEGVKIFNHMPKWYA